MNSQPQASTSATPVPGGVQPKVATPEEQAQHQAKMQKKARKHERLRFFFGWCEGCRAFGEGF